ncbi:hypothetical protein EDB81DRAFT_431955 [Dactylonectria macrodidyma]|uniref:Secreted protein n=1 Tax=Dactylonectria macrodidyma TaxID=307937 RepID=A0A9P9F1D5_9HYPO|nr:hypothetical protein EDB81DRAFT_431955 [Dactylonectria macrodidyma]
MQPLLVMLLAETLQCVSLIPLHVPFPVPLFLCLLRIIWIHSVTSASTPFHSDPLRIISASYPHSVFPYLSTVSVATLVHPQQSVSHPLSGLFLIPSQFSSSISLQSLQFITVHQTERQILLRRTETAPSSFESRRSAVHQRLN